MPKKAIPQYALEQIQQLKNNRFMLRGYVIDDQEYNNDLKNIELIAQDSPLADKIKAAKYGSVKKLISEAIDHIKNLDHEIPASYNVWMRRMDEVYEYVTNQVKYPVKDMYEVLDNAQCALVFYHTAILQLENYLENNPAASGKLLEKCTELTNKVRVIVASVVVNKATSEEDRNKLKEGLDGKFLKDALVLIRCIAERDPENFEAAIAKMKKIGDLNVYGDANIDEYYDDVIKYHKKNDIDEKNTAFNKIIETFTEVPANYEKLELVQDVMKKLYDFARLGYYPAADMAMQISMFIYETPEVFKKGTEYVLMLLEEYQQKEGERLWQMATKGLGIAAIKLGANPNLEGNKSKMDLLLTHLDYLMLKYPEQKMLILESSYIAQNIDGKEETLRMWELLGQPAQRFEARTKEETDDILGTVFTPTRICTRIRNLLEIYPYDVLQGLQKCEVETLDKDMLKIDCDWLLNTILMACAKIPDGENLMSERIWGMLPKITEQEENKAIKEWRNKDIISGILNSIETKKVLNTNDAVALNIAAQLYGTSKRVNQYLQMHIKNYIYRALNDEKCQSLEPHAIDFLKNLAIAALKDKNANMLNLEFLELIDIQYRDNRVSLASTYEDVFNMFKEIYNILIKDEDMFKKCQHAFSRKIQELHFNSKFFLNMDDMKVNPNMFRAFYELVVLALNTTAKICAGHYTESYPELIGIYHWFIERYETVLDAVPTVKWDNDSREYKKGYTLMLKQLDQDNVVSNLAEYDQGEIKPSADVSFIFDDEFEASFDDRI